MKTSKQYMEKVHPETMKKLEAHNLRGAVEVMMEGFAITMCDEQRRLCANRVEPIDYLIVHGTPRPKELQ